MTQEQITNIALCLEYIRLYAASNPLSREQKYLLEQCILWRMETPPTPKTGDTTNLWFPIGVDYPVVQGEDNEHYLHYTFDGKENIAGSIFLDYRNRADFTDRKVILYGHNMQDGSMFSHLEKY